MIQAWESEGVGGDRGTYSAAVLAGQAQGLGEDWGLKSFGPTMNKRLLRKPFAS